jgi:hypothetical protein
VLTLGELWELPESVERGHGCGVYFLWDGAELVYIGSSVDMNSRRYMHFAANRYKGESYHNSVQHDRCTMLTLDRETYREVEREYIAHYDPPGNKQGNPHRCF